MKRAHLSDERLIEICLADPLAPVDEPHLRDCERCERRRLALASTLSDVTSRVLNEADAAFPDERLARQHARIMLQVEQIGRPARIIAFPAPPTAEPLRPTVRHGRRWIAATGAIAVAFLVGVFTEHLTHRMPPASRRVETRMAAAATPDAAVARTVAASMSMSDDELLLGQIEAAVYSSGPAALRPLDALTPRAWDVQ